MHPREASSYRTGCGGGEMEIDAGTDAEVPLVAVAVETVAPAEVRAGQTVMISCLLFVTSPGRAGMFLPGVPVSFLPCVKYASC